MAISAVLSRRNSIATSIVPPKLTLQSLNHFSSFPLDLHIFPTPTSYTSLKDILPYSVPDSPAPSASSSGYQIAIRNRLVKQAAWAYLQPMSTSPGSNSRSFFSRNWSHFSDNCVVRAVTRSFYWLLRMVRIR